MFTILQLSADFQYQKLYPNIVRGLSSTDISQVIYLQSRDECSYTELDEVLNVHIVQSFRFKFWMKLLFKRRVNFIAEDIEKEIDVSSINITMAYFLFSDGSVANEIFKKYSVPFVVAIRNSDINHYFKYRFWLKPYVKEVLINASTIVFPSPSYIDAVKNIVGEVFFQQVISNKIEVVGNIVDESWFLNVPVKTLSNEPVSLLYAGEFSKNKRIDKIVSAFNLFSKVYNARLFLVGNYGDDVESVGKLVEGNSNITVIDKIVDTIKLISVFDKCHVFLMPSKTETFGNVYVEAMARGLPIIYTKGQGIDGYFPDGEVGFSVKEPLENEIFFALE